MEGKENKPKLSCIWRKLFNLIRGQLALEGLRKVVTEGKAKGTSDQRWRKNVDDIQQNGSNSKVAVRERVLGAPITIPVESPTGLKDILVDEELSPQQDTAEVGNAKQMHEKGAHEKDGASVNHKSKEQQNHGKTNGEVRDINQRSKDYIKRKKNDLSKSTNGSPGTPKATAAAPSSNL